MESVDFAQSLPEITYYLFFLGFFLYPEWTYNPLYYLARHSLLDLYRLASYPY